MAEIFKRAYDEVNRRLNGSGLSSIVHRQEGGIAEDVESQRVHGTSPFDIYRHGEAYAKPPGNQPAASSSPWFLEDFGRGGQPSPEMQRRVKANREQGLRGMIQGGFDNPEQYWTYMQNWAKKAEKARSDAYWAEHPEGYWIDETIKSGITGIPDLEGKSLALPEQAPISINEAINNIEEDLKAGLISVEEAKSQIDYIVALDNEEGMVNRDMAKLHSVAQKEMADIRSQTSGNTGGGIADLKKSININGQPHDLAWIRPDEASALKAMGGSGKKVEGIPAYYFGWAGDEGGDADWGIEEVADTGGSATGGEGQYAEATGGSDIGGEYVAGDTYTYDSPTFIDTTRTTGDSDRGGVTPSDGDSDSKVTGLPWLDKESREDWLDEKSDRRKGFLGLFGDYYTNREALERAHMVGYDNWRATAGKYSENPGKDYDEWYNAQDKGALLAGYAIGDPFGKAMEFKMRQVNEQLQDMFRKAKDLKSVGQEDEEPAELSKEELQEAVKDIEGLKDFTPYSGTDYPIWAPGGVLVAGMNLASSTVIGVGTVNGIRVHVHENGTVTAISPEDSPGFLSGEDTGNEPQGRRSRRPVREVASVSEEVTETPATGMAGLLAKRPDIPSTGESFQSQFDALANIYGRERAAEMLNQPENIFA